jgi:four helix bundle protein
MSKNIRGEAGAITNWKRARELVLAVYSLTQTFPKEEMFGLAVQPGRAAVSIPSNIAEGAARAGEREFAQFLNIARGSLSELVDRVSRFITGLRKSIQRELPITRRSLLLTPYS